MTRRLLLVLAVFLCYIIVVLAQRAKSSAENDDDPFALLEDMEGAIVPPEHHESNLHHILAAISHAFAILIRFSGYLAKPLTFAGGYLYSFAVWFGGILAYVAAPVLVLLQVAWMICIEWPMALIHYLAETLFPVSVNHCILSSLLISFSSMYFAVSQQSLVHFGEALEASFLNLSFRSSSVQMTIDTLPTRPSC